MISKRSLKFLNLASAASILSDVKKYQLGAAITKGTDVLAVGFNQEKSHPLQKKYNKERGVDSEWSFLHAEISALSKVKNKKLLRGAVMYTSRKFKCGSNANARPCAGCMKAIIDFGIKEIVYTTNHGIAREFIQSKV